jgi:hypothetical protein
MATFGKPIHFWSNQMLLCLYRNDCINSLHRLINCFHCIEHTFAIVEILIYRFGCYAFNSIKQTNWIIKSQIWKMMMKTSKGQQTVPKSATKPIQRYKQ